MAAPAGVPDSQHPRASRRPRRLTLGLFAAIVVVAILLLSTSSLAPPTADPPRTLSHARAAPGASAASVGPGPTELATARLSLAQGLGPAASGSHPGTAARALTSPTIGQATSLAYDATDHYVLAIAPNVTGSGNTSGWGSVVQTWTFSAGNWTQLPIAYAPPNRGYSSMVYDAIDDYVLVFGGTGFGGSGGVFGWGGYLGDTWRFAAGNWTNLTGTLAVSPGPRAYAPITWDGADGYALMVGGMGPNGNVTGNLSQTWTYVSGVWAAGTANSLLQHQGAIAYDAADGYVVYFGGAYSGPGTSNETWEYLNGTWTRLTSLVSGAPPSRANPSLSYDPNLRALLLFGGIGQPVPPGWVYYNDTWAYANRTWTLLSSASGPAPREQAQMVFDAADNETVLYGGINYSYGAYGDTWAFSGSGNGTVARPVPGLGSLAWAQTAPVVSVTRSVIELGSRVTITVWGVQGTAASFNFTGLPTGCLSVDAPELMCNATAPGNYSIAVTVVTTTGTAEALTHLVVLPPISVGTFTVSPTLTEVGGSITYSVSTSGGLAPLGFVYAGLPPGCPNTNAATITCTTTSAGAFDATVNVTDALGVVAASNVVVQVIAPLTVGALTVAPAVIDLTQTSYLSLVRAGGLAPFSYAFAGLPPGCASSGGQSLACIPTSTGSFAVAASVTDHLGFSVAATGTLVVHPDPTIDSFVASATNVTLGGSLTFTVAASGGTGALSYQYGGLPTGCLDVNRSTLTCTPTAEGTYLVEVSVLDAVGVSTVSNLTIEVVHAPIIPPPGGPATPGGGGSSGNSGSAPNAATLFYVGLAVGLVVFVIGVGLLARRSRLAREGEALVRELRELPLKVGGTVDGGPPGAPARGSGTGGPHERDSR